MAIILENNNFCNNNTLSSRVQTITIPSFQCLLMGWLNPWDTLLNSFAEIVAFAVAAQQKTIQQLHGSENKDLTVNISLIVLNCLIMIIIIIYLKAMEKPMAVLWL